MRCIDRFRYQISFENFDAGSTEILDEAHFLGDVEVKNFEVKNFTYHKAVDANPIRRMSA